MTFKPLPPLRGMSGVDDSYESLSVHSTSSTAIARDPARRMWLQTQWVNLSLQAKNIGLSKLPYFDPDTMILSKEVNARLWKQLLKLYDHLGERQAPYATPVLAEDDIKKTPELKWHSFMDGQKGQEAEVYDR